jgi:hypothetical protein
MERTPRRRAWRQLPALLLIAGGALAACTAPDTYPISGEPCAEDDPVRGIRAGECLPAG